MSVDVLNPGRPAGQRPRQPGVRLLEAVPELQRGVPAADRAAARNAILAPTRTIDRGPLTIHADDSRASPFAWIILEGIVLRRTYVGSQPGTEMLGEGDIVDVRRQTDGWSLPTRTQYAVHRTATVAVLDDRFRAAAQRWPGLYEAVAEHQAAYSRRVSRHLAAALGLSRVEDRLVALFTDLADRWGRVTPEGVVIDVDLTHTLLGELVGSRRPTVSLALRELSHAGTVVRRPDRTWLLAPELGAVA